MSAKAKLDGKQVRAMLEVWRGDVKHAAEELGVTRRSLYNKIARLGIDLGVLRAERTYEAKGYTDIVDTNVSSTVLVAVSDPNSPGGSVQPPNLNTILGAMMQRGGEALRIAGSDLMGNQKAPQPAKLRREVLDHVQAARIQYQAIHGCELTNSAFLERLVVEYLPIMMSDEMAKREAK